MAIYQAAMGCQAVEPSNRTPLPQLLAELKTIARGMKAAGPDAMDTELQLPEQWARGCRRKDDEEKIYGVSVRAFRQHIF